MGKEFVTEKEKKNRKRGMLIAFFFHAALIIFGLLPFLTREVKEPKYEKVIEIQFAQFDASSKKADDKAGAKKKTEKKKTTEKKVEKPKPEPKPEPKKTKPVLTDEKSKAPPIKTTPKPKKVEKKKKKTTKPAPKPTKEVEETAEEADASEAATESTKESSGDAAENGKGKGDHGKDKGEGKAGEGKDGDDFKGTAIFSRKVIYRPDIKKIVKKKGRIAINLCINNEGRVVYVKYDKDASTIRDNDNIRKTLEATKLYKFERDYSVPKQQCGKLTFIIDN